MSQIKAFKKSTTKISTKESWYIFFIVLLCIAIAFLAFIYFNNPYIPKTNQETSCPNIGTDITIDIEDCGGFSRVLSLSGMLLPDFETEQNAYIRLNSSSQNCKARAKVFMFDDSGKNINLNANFTSNWEENQDGYFYYTGTISPSIVLKFLKSITVPSTNLYSGNQYLVFITVETLPENINPQNIWLNN